MKINIIVKIKKYYKIPQKMQTQSHHSSSDIIEQCEYCLKVSKTYYCWYWVSFFKMSNI